MKVIIAGSRNIPPKVSYPLVLKAVAEFEAQHSGITEIVSGAEPRGVDRQGETWAEGMMIPITRFPYVEGMGRRGGPIRNSQMAAYADGLIVIHENTPGSRDMIKKAQAQARKRAFPIVEVKL
ncbi:hypothetical protein [Deinococcus arenicola]|uniref:DUF2493 domain-containing protein n=1 Tax=Deinococcus arenicola TaxID=2994950 RepID=A0ABU4DVL6_9DEIO|nr:hypothetical protein [Deinococcus sp. ZS9-10]MDV6376466.1 hypothetical protein [Deinococcus sp. ZS9-10]